MTTGIRNFPRGVLSTLDRLIKDMKGRRGRPDGFVGTDSHGLAETEQLGTGTADATSYLRGDNVWAVPAGTGTAGDVVGDDVSVSVQNIAAYNNVDGKHITELTGTQGQVLYHNGTVWSKLGAGTSGYFLQTLGAGANPAWAAQSSGLGDVTAGDLTVTSGNLVAYNGGGGTSIVEFGGVQGDIAYHNGTSWVKLSASTDGYVLGTQGASANPRWIPGANGRYVDNVADLMTAVAAGGKIFLAAGNYELTGTLVLNVAHTELIGAGLDVTYLRVNDYNTDIISIQNGSITISDLSLQHSTFAAGTGNGKGLAGSGKGIVFEMQVTSSDNFGNCNIKRVNILCTASWGIYDTGGYAMEDISYGDGFASAGLFSDTAEHPFPIWGYKTAVSTSYTISSTRVATRTITSAGLFANVRVGNFVTGTGITHGTWVTAKASDSSITVSKDVTAGGPTDLVFSRRTNCRITVDNVIEDCNIAFQNSGGALFLGYAGTTTKVVGLKTNCYSFGSFCAHNDTTPTAACTRGSVDIYGTTTNAFYDPIFQSPSKQSGVVSTAHDDTDATMLSIRSASSVNFYTAYFEVLSQNCEDGVDWRARGEDTYGYRQYWLITGHNSVSVTMDSAYFGCTTKKLDPAWLLGGTYYAGFPARILRTLDDAGGFNFSLIGGRVGHWREFYSAAFGHPTPTLPFEYGDFYPVPELGSSLTTPYDDDDFLLQGTDDGTDAFPILIQDLAIPNYNTGERRLPTYPTATAIGNRNSFRMHNSGRPLKLGYFLDTYKNDGADSMDFMTHVGKSQDLKGGMIAYSAGSGTGSGTIQREGIWAVSNRDHDWRQLPFMRIHPSIWSPVYAGDMWMRLHTGSGLANPYTGAEYRWYDGAAWRVIVGLATGTTATGDLIYYSASDTPVRLGVGTVGSRLTVAGGVPSWAFNNGTSSIAARTTNLGSTTLLTGTAATAGLYNVSFYLACGVAGDAGDTVTITLTYNDGTARTNTSVVLDASVTTVPKGAVVTIHAAASTNITYTATVSSPGAGTPSYSVEARLEAVG